MAERRMFAKTIVLSDAFLDMPLGARCLYMTLGMVADDDGFVNAPRSVMRQTGATDDDMKILLAKKFVLLFEDGVIVIKHWRINNYLQKDRYKETVYKDDKQLLEVEENGAYKLSGQKENDVYTTVYTQDRLGKDSIDKDSKEHTFICDEQASVSAAQIENEFDMLWNIYPRKEGKRNALKHYRKARDKGVTFETVKAGLLAYIECLKRENRPADKVKIGSTWFCQNCWEDEYTSTVQKKPTVLGVANISDIAGF